MLLESDASIAVSLPQEEVTEIIQTITQRYHMPWFVVSIIFTVVAIAVAKVLTHFISKGLTNLSRRNPKFTVLMCSLAKRISSVMIWIIDILIVLQSWGINLTPIFAGLGITGVILGFALQESISSLFSGIMIAVNNPFRVGDWVEIGSVAGTVEAMDLMCVTLSSADNKRIILANKNVWGSTIVNYSYTNRRRVDMAIGVSYDSDLKKTKEVITDLLLSYPEVLKTPVPVVEVKEYRSSDILFAVRPWVVPSDYWTVYWRFHGEILGVLNRNGIDMQYDTVEVHIRKEGD